APGRRPIWVGWPWPCRCYDWVATVDGPPGAPILAHEFARLCICRRRAHGPRKHALSLGSGRGLSSPPLYSHAGAAVDAAEDRPVATRREVSALLYRAVLQRRIRWVRAPVVGA